MRNSRSQLIVGLTFVAILAVTLFRTIFPGEPADGVNLSAPASEESLAHQQHVVSLEVAPDERRSRTEEGLAIEADRSTERTVEPSLEDVDLPPEEIDWEEIDWSDAEHLEHAGLPLDTPVSPRIGRAGPPDPRETGDAKLVLSLRDRATGEPVESQVVLWDLAAPANAFWTSGDQDVAEVRIGREGGEFEGLAAGEYRIVCLEERAAAPHQPAFFVSGRTELELFLELPHPRPARLQISGREPPLPRVEARFHPVSIRSPEWRIPPWVRPREIQPTWDGLVVWDSSESSSDVVEPEWTPLFETPLGHDLGMFPGDARGRWHEQRIDLRTDEGWRATFELNNGLEGDVATVIADLSLASEGD